MSTQYASSNAFLGIGAEAVVGVAAASYLWIPMSTPKWTPKAIYIPDEGLRGSPVSPYDSVPGVWHDEITFKTSIFADTWPLLMLAALGSADTLTGTTPLYSHKIGLENNAATGSQPFSCTIQYFDGSQCRQLVGARLSSLEITWKADGTIDASHTWLSQPYTNIAAPSESFSTEHLIPGWDHTITLGTVPSPVSVSGSLSIKRNVKPIQVGGQRNPRNLFADKLMASGKLMFVLESGDPTIVDATIRDQQAMNVTFTDPVSTDNCELQMSAIQMMNPTIEPGQQWLQVGADYTANADTTDAISGYSSLLSITNNHVSSAYVGS